MLNRHLSIVSFTLMDVQHVLQVQQCHTSAVHLVAVPCGRLLGIGRELRHPLLGQEDVDDLGRGAVPRWHRPAGGV